jgi:thrombospondin type 3 repeat protein
MRTTPDRGRRSRVAILALSVLCGLTTAHASSPLFLVDSTFGANASSIYRVDPATGALTKVADLGSTYSPLFGLAAAGSGVLYAAGNDNGPTAACGPQLGCLLLRIQLDPSSTTPLSVPVVGVVQQGGTIVKGITGLTFDETGTLLAASQETDDLWSISPATATAARIGPFGLDDYGGDLAVDGTGRLWIWTNAPGIEGLYEVNRQTASATPYDLHPGQTFAGFTAIGHGQDLRGASAAGDELARADPLYGLTGDSLPLTLGGAPFDFSRGDLDSPFCTDDAACDDGNPCTTDQCTPSGCVRTYDASCCGTSDPDGDGVPGTCDNCPIDPNPNQADRDGDGSGDACDSDDDGDGVPDAADCAPEDPSASVPPVEVTGLTVRQMGTTLLDWDGQGAGFRYDVVSGHIADLGAVPPVAPGCFRNNLSVSNAPDNRPDPPPGAGLYYLVRAQNRCGLGDYGTDSSGHPRSPGGCP